VKSEQHPSVLKLSRAVSLGLRCRHNRLGKTWLSSPLWAAYRPAGAPPRDMQANRPLCTQSPPCRDQISIIRILHMSTTPQFSIQANTLSHAHLRSTCNKPSTLNVCSSSPNSHSAPVQRPPHFPDPALQSPISFTGRPVDPEPGLKQAGFSPRTGL
jgi:hypothetical protein